MITPSDMQHLRSEMIHLRQRLISRTMTEHDVWALLQKAESMLDEAKGGEFEKDIKLIYSMLSIVWNNTREVNSLHRDFER